MKKSLITLSILSAFTAPITFAEQTNSSPNIDEFIGITANRSTQEQFDTLAAIDIFDRNAIEKINPLSVAELLNHVAGVTTSTQGTTAHTTSVFVRGSNSDHVLILVNGVRVGSATLGVKDIATIPMQLIERVEVIRGPRSALWGSDAIGGVIQIFTRKLDSGNAQVGLKLGTNNLWQIYGSVGFGFNYKATEHQYTLSSVAEKSSGFDVITPDPNNPFSIDQNDDDGYSTESLSLNGTSQITQDYSIELSAQYDQGTTEIDANTLYSGDETDYKNHHFLLRNHVQLEQAYLQFSLITSQDNSEDNLDNYNPSVSANLFITKRKQLSTIIEIPFAKNSEVVTGAEWYKETITSNNSFSETSRNATSAFVTTRHNIDQIKLEASIRYDDIENINSETTYQLALGYQPNDKVIFALSHGTAFKAPTFNDLYYPWVGNENLVSEIADNTELLTRYNHENFQVEVSFFQTDYDNLIDWAPIDPNDPFSPWRPENINKAKIVGGEATLSMSIAETNNRLTLSHIDAENEATGRQLAKRPHFSAHYNLNYPLSISDNLIDITFDINYQGQRYNSGSAFSKKLDAITLINLGANYQVNEQLHLSAKVTNLADKDYQQVSEYPGDKRGYSISIDYRF